MSASGGTEGLWSSGSSHIATDSNISKPQLCPNPTTHPQISVLHCEDWEKALKVVFASSCWELLVLTIQNNCKQNKQKQKRSYKSAEAGLLYTHDILVETHLNNVLIVWVLSVTYYTVWLCFTWLQTLVSCNVEFIVVRRDWNIALSPSLSPRPNLLLFIFSHPLLWVSVSGPQTAPSSKQSLQFVFKMTKTYFKALMINDKKLVNISLPFVWLQYSHRSTCINLKKSY